MKKFLAILTSIVVVGCSQDPAELLNQAVAAADEDNWAVASNLSQKAASSSQDVTIQSFYAICLEHQQEFEKAHIIWQDLVAANPEEFTLIMMLGKSFFRQQDYENTFSTLKKIYAKDPKNLELNLMLFQSAAALKKGTAMTYWNTIKDDKETQAMSLNNLGVLHQLRNSKKAYKYLLLSARSANPPAELLLNQAIVLDTKEMYSGALTFYRKYTTAMRNEPNELTVKATQRITELEKLLENDQ